MDEKKSRDTIREALGSAVRTVDEKEAGVATLYKGCTHEAIHMHHCDTGTSTPNNILRANKSCKWDVAWYMGGKWGAELIN